ncbi:YIP1 family protein [Cohnella phaseoli]|uniref:SMP-30/gluconolaconase/LRE-like protein n=1 Tax=Cohnella phaseoli TaxID=456490 RepID=A0A3D9KTR3_9BACL|nr:YIP1 family protein [Cohnella phaseoli]RED89045.1 SMP-30/gluconolaconase/LRE-like protein [Cohnella phaseoli]
MLISSKTLRQMIRIGIAAVLGVVLLQGADRPVYAELPYTTYSSDMNKWIRTPNAFVPKGVWGGLNHPEDLFITSRDELYVADTGNNRIVQLDLEGHTVRTIPDPTDQDPKAKLRKPEGVFVTEDGVIYVADTGSRRIAIFDRDGRYMQELLAPSSELLPATFVYAPLKVVVDQRGYIYMVTKGGYQGLLQLAPDGSFAGFYGANKVPTSWLDSLKRKFFTEEQLKEELSRLPGAVTNVTLDAQGFMFTVNKDLKSGQLKRLNFGGVDLLMNRNFAPWVKPLDKFSFQDVHVDSHGVMSAAETTEGKIYQYDKYGELLFVFGTASVGSEQRLGMFKRVTSIVADSHGSLYIADGEQNRIQIMKRTHFGELVHQASYMDNQGKYEEARELWEEIHRLNGMYDRAYLGIAKAKFKTGDYEQAMTYFEQAKDKDGYSESFWQVRMNFLLRYFGTGMTVLAIALIGFFLYRRIIRSRKKRRLIRDQSEDSSQILPQENRRWAHRARNLAEPWKMMLGMLRHPMNGMYDIAVSTQVRWRFALFFVVLGFILLIAGKAVVSMLFAAQRFETLNLTMEAMKYFLPWLSWIIANYLTGSVMRGEGSFGKVFVVNSYALAPYILFILPIQWLSNVLTLQEGIFYAAANYVIVLWVLILIFVGTQNVHNYNLKEAIGMMSVSIVTFLCLWVFGFVLIGLIYQATDFVAGFGREVWLRVR